MRGSSKHLDSVKEATEGSGEEGCGWHCTALEEGMGNRQDGGGKGSQMRSRLPAQAAAPITHSLRNLPFPCPGPRAGSGQGVPLQWQQLWEGGGQNHGPSLPQV